MPDRFNNGDASNDLVNAPAWQLDAEKAGDISNVCQNMDFWPTTLVISAG